LFASLKSDSLSVAADSIAVADSSATDSTTIPKKKPAEFKSKVQYWAKDSMPLSMDLKRVYLYGDAKVVYEAEKIELKAAYIDYDFANSQVFAKGMFDDSLHRVAGKPEFKQGDETYTADELSYNFKTGKAYIKGGVTKQGDGILHSQKTKRGSDGSIFVKNGIYSTCDAQHQHYGLVLTKGKVIPGDKVIFGPAYLMLEDVPLPVAVPFGFFPSRRESTSGIIIPTYGEEKTRGFYLTDGGYYFALSDYYDLLLTGDIYSKGSWGIGAASNYKVRYKFSGSFQGNYNLNKTGIAGIDSGSNVQTISKDFSIRWTHNQDPLANPSSSFRASVDYSTTSYDRNQSYTDATRLMTAQKNSSISFSKNWTNFNLATNLGASQNSATQTVSLTLPSASFSANRIYPFRGKDYNGEGKWYHNISINYTAALENRITDNEDSVFTKKAFRNAQNGFKHSIPLSLNLKFLKFFNFTPSLTYDGRVYTNKIKIDTAWNSKTQSTYTITRIIDGLYYAHGFTPSASVSFTPTVYGMAQFKSTSKIQAIRHVITPTASFSFVPGIDQLVPNYYDKYTINGKTTEYSIYGGTRNVYGTPTVPRRSGSLSFGVGNNVEMKVKSDKDTVTGLKKIVLIQSLSLSSSYNPYGTKNKRLSNISINGTTPIYGDVSLSYNGTINPYSYNYRGTGDSAHYYWKDHKYKIGRLTNAGLSFGYSFKFGDKAGAEPDKGGKNDKKETPKASAGRQKSIEEFNYFDIPMSLSFSYSLSYSKTTRATKTVTQSLSFNGAVPLTPKWMITFNSSYDFRAHDFGYTSFTIHRDLHCWEMNVSCSPFGTYKFYEFKINTKASILRDLKYEQRKDYRDYYNY
jgi:hypothetical protein